MLSSRYLPKVYPKFFETLATKAIAGMPAAPRVTRNGGFAVVAVIACQGQAHLPIQLSCLDVCQAVWFATRQ